MRLALLLTAAGMLNAQSNPSWWKYTPPEATGVVGMHWDNLRETRFASAIAAEFAAGGALNFPDLEILRNPEQVLLASPTLLAIEYGNFPATTVREQAAAKGMKKGAYKGMELWSAPDSGTLNIALINPKLVLVGSKVALQNAIDRGLDERSSRGYSPLLARAARYSKEDLWVVASQLPDPLASRFLPLELQATAFEGSVSFWDGLHLVASIERPSPTRALDLADSLVEALAARPVMAQATEITTRDRAVLITMDLDQAQLFASLRAPESAASELVAAAPAKPQPRAFVPPTPVASSTRPSTEPTVIASAAPPAEITAAPATALQPASTLPPPPPRPKVIRILGLGDGPVEIPFGH
ncbi:MAG: hypothetical protein ABI811_09085 [Acidobacteriota bacterium]